MSELPCPYCGFNCEIPSNTEEKIECPNCGSIFLYIQNSRSHGTIDYRPSPEINDRGRQMSELKAVHAFDVYEAYTKTGDDDAAQVYLKSEADNVISTIRAERDEYRYNLSCARNEIHNLSMSMREDVKRIADKDKVIAELKADYKEACDRLQTANLIKDEQLAATRHHKYKRCLAMARWCCDACDKWMMRKVKAIGLGKEGVKEFHHARSKLFHYMRWQTRWLKLAKKFNDKETK